MEVKINGVTYESKPETEGCFGCVARNNSQLCSEITNSDEGCNMSDGVIWVKKETNEEPKYTAEDVLSAIEQFGYIYFTEQQAVTIKEYLAKQNNPDYQLYLKLKEQFKE